MKTPLGTEVDFGPRHIVLDGDPSPTAKGAQQPCPLFSAPVYCGHGRLSQLLLSSCPYVLGLGPGDIVLDKDPAPQKGHNTPHFLAHVYCGQTAGRIKMPLGMQVGHTVLDGDPSHPPPKGHIPPPNFRPMSVVVSFPDPLSGWMGSLSLFHVPHIPGLGPLGPGFLGLTEEPMLFAISLTTAMNNICMLYDLRNEDGHLHLIFIFLNGAFHKTPTDYST